MANHTHWKITFGGLLYGGPMNWSCGFRFGSLTGGDITIPNADDDPSLVDWYQAVRQLNGGAIIPNELRGLMSSEADLRTVRFAAIGTDGKEKYVYQIEGAPISAGSGGAKNPSQIALAFTLRSRLPGATNRGRVYWPALGAGVGPGGVLVSTIPAAVSADMGHWLYDIANAGASIVQPAKRPIVVSTTRGTEQEIRTVAVGNRLDVQRRRADKQEETYGVAPVAKQG